MLIHEGRIGNYIYQKGQRYDYFAGNDYLGLAVHPTIVQAAQKALADYGINTAASRVTTGTNQLHQSLEKVIALFKGKEDSIVFPSGYMGNKILLQQILSDDTVLFIDKQSHASILDAIPRSFNNYTFFDHVNPSDLEAKIKKIAGQKPVVATDGVFSISGRIAPIDAYLNVVEPLEGIIIVDDCHSTGVLGERGRGTPEYFGLDQHPFIFQTETFSKALGVYGGFIAGTKKMIKGIKEKSKMYSGTTATAPVFLSAAIASLQLLEQDKNIRDHLKDNIAYACERLNAIGLEVYARDTPIFPVYLSNAKQAESLEKYLTERKIIAPCFTNSGTYKGNLLRITITAMHEKKQIKKLTDAIHSWRLLHR